MCLKAFPQRHDLIAFRRVEGGRYDKVGFENEEVEDYLRRCLTKNTTVPNNFTSSESVLTGVTRSSSTVR